MWYIEEFGADDWLVADHLMSAMTDELLPAVIQLRNTEDWIRGVGHPIEIDELQKFDEYLDKPFRPSPLNSYFAAFYQD